MQSRRLFGYRRAAQCAAVLLFAAGAASCSVSHRSATPPPSAVSATSATTLASTGATHVAASPFDWSRSLTPALTVGGGPTSTLSALITPQPGGVWQLYGTQTLTSGLPEPMTWSSPDGVTWQAKPLPGAPLVGTINAATLYNGETVAVGSIGTGASEEAAVWFSAEPGAPLTRVAVSTGTGASQMSAVTAGPLGFFAIGTFNGSFAMWSSVSGQQWRPNAGAQRVIDASPGAKVNTLVSVGTDVYAGGSVPNGPTVQAALWLSGDGITWSMVGQSSRAFAGAANEEIFSIAPLTQGLVAVGGINFGSGWVPASWISPNGVSWSQPSTDFPVPSSVSPSALGPSGGMTAFDVSQVTGSVSKNSLIAAGGGPDGQGVWRSTDGLHWSSGGLPSADASLGSWRATAAGATYSTTVVVDTRAGQPYLLDMTSKGWVQPSSNPAVFGPVQPKAVPLALTSVAGSLVLDADEVDRSQTIGPATVSLKTFSSSDGVSWIAQNPASPFPPNLPSPSAVTLRLSNGWMAVGTGAEGVPEAWVSSDGVNWKSQGVLPTPSATSGAALVNGTCRVTSGTSQSSTSTTRPGVSTTTVPSTSPTTTAKAPTSSTAADTTTGAPSSLVLPSLVVAVGSAPQPVQTSSHPSTLPSGVEAQVWYSKGGAGWQAGTVSPAPVAGATESMSGCVDIGGTLVAFGSSTSPDGNSVPAVWKSTDGATWVRSKVSSFVPGTADPLTTMANNGSEWIALANPDPGAHPQAPGPSASAGGIGPAASMGSDIGLGSPLASTPTKDGIWLTSNAGKSWQSVPLDTTPWLTSANLQLDLVAFRSSNAVVVGTVAGQLAVWIGTPPSGGSTQSTTTAP